MIIQQVCKMEMSTLQIQLLSQILSMNISLQLLIKYQKNENMKVQNRIETFWQTD